MSERWGHVGDAVTVAAHRVAEQGNDATVDRDQAEHRLDQRGLSGAVGADDGAQSSGPEAAAGVVEHPPPPVGDSQAVEAEALVETHEVQPLRKPSATALALARIIPT